MAELKDYASINELLVLASCAMATDEARHAFKVRRAILERCRKRMKRAKAKETGL